ncbi:MAG: hypothetical protein LDL31_08995, partial [Prosthecobacter sp.]|nr:hypothetical protein [Prosthecobacter sp.]
MTWLASPSSGDWNTGANWSSGTVPAANDVLFFGSSAVTTLNNNIGERTFNGLTFTADAAAYTLTGSRINLGGGITNNSTHLQTLEMNLGSVSSQVRTWTMTAGGGDFLFTGNLLAGGILTAGSGTLTLAGTNTAANNALTIGADTTLRLSSAANLTDGSVNSTLGINLGGRLELRHDTGFSLTAVNNATNGLRDVRLNGGST